MQLVLQVLRCGRNSTSFGSAGLMDMNAASLQQRRMPQVSSQFKNRLSWLIASSSMSVSEVYGESQQSKSTGQAAHGICTSLNGVDVSKRPCCLP